MDIVMSNVNLDKIEILERVNIELYFSNSYDGRPLQKILCHNVLNLSFGTCGDIDEFPLFICDVELRTLKDEDAQSALASFPNAFKLSELTECKFLCLESGEVSIWIICEGVKQGLESDSPCESPDTIAPLPTMPAPALPPHPTYPIYVSRTYPDGEGPVIVYSFGYSPDNLFAKFGVNSETHKPYGIDTTKTAGKEAYQIVTNRLHEFVMAQPEHKYPQKLVIERDGVSGVE